MKSERFYATKVITMYEDEDYIYSLYFCKNVYLVKDTQKGNTFENIKTYNDGKINRQEVFEMDDNLWIKSSDSNINCYLMSGSVRQIKNITKYLQYII
jgi:hypothetical protein